MGPTQALKMLVGLEFGVLVALLRFLCCIKAELHIVNTPSPITASLGKNVTIPCVLTEDDHPQLDLDLSIVGIRWRKIYSNGSEIDVYKFLSLNHVPIRPESSIDERKLRRGDVSLTLGHVKRSDEGEYTCTVFVTPNKAWAKINVQVVAQPDVALSTTELAVETESEKSVICEVSNYYPETVKIRWVKYSKSSGTISSLDKVTYLTVPEENSDESFNVTSLLTVRPSSLMENGDSYSCKVTHVSFSHDKEVSFILTVKEQPTNSSLIAGIIIMILILILAIVVPVYFIFFRKIPPKISDIAGIDDLVHGKKSTLTWMVSGFKPKDIEINAYLLRGDKRQEIPWMTPFHDYDDVDSPGKAEQGILLQKPNAKQPPALKNSLFSYSRLCFSSITPDKQKDKEAELVIEVKHDALKSILTKIQKLKIKGDFFSCYIKAPQCLKPGEEVTLTCDITKCDPGPLTITWLKGKQVIYMDDSIQDSRYSYAETLDEPQEGNVLKTSSSLTFRAQINEDHGMKYTCKVYYSAINKILGPHLETFITAPPVMEQIASKQVGEQMELSCLIQSFLPETIEIKWFKEDEELPTTDCELRTGEDGLYSTTSILMYIPQIEDIGKTFNCQVDHQSLSCPVTRQWRSKEPRRNGIKS